MACSVDWPLALDFVKVLASPTATVVSVILVAWFGVRTFRSQKALERRLEWYQDMHALLVQTADAFAIAAAPSAGADGARTQARINRANTLTQQLGQKANDAWLYADQHGLDAVQRLSANLAEWLAESPGVPTKGQAGRVAPLCLLTADALSKGMRRRLGLKPLRPRSTALPIPPDLAT